LDTYSRALEFKRKQNEPRKKRKSIGEVKLINKFHESLTYHYVKEGKPYIEAHVDMVYTYSDSDDEIGLPKLDDPETGGIRGWLSCRMLPCVWPATTTGQDEVIFHPSTMNEMVWMIDGITPLRSKGGTEHGKMISGTKTRMQGFCSKLSNDDFEKVNEKRQGQCYSGYAAEAARNIQGLSRKKSLTESPFVRMIDYGAAKDGYWNANHMLVQVEDWMSWGKGRKMRESVLTDACVGTIERKDRVYPGCTHSHSFLPSDKPPVFFDGKEPPPEHDIVLERNSEKKVENKDDLVRDLDTAGIKSKGNIPVLKERCRQAGISLEKNLDKLIPGFAGKPKGALQILYERGFIDANKKNAGGKIVSWKDVVQS
jgi:hypothetical protein